MMKLEFYKYPSRGWRWRLRASNGQILARAAQWYTRRYDAWRGFCRVLEALDTGRFLVPPPWGIPYKPEERDLMGPLEPF
jgi:uncharacterized protein YegP (UPF0339 family)